MLRLFDLLLESSERRARGLPYVMGEADHVPARAGDMPGPRLERDPPRLEEVGPRIAPLDRGPDLVAEDGFRNVP